MKGDPVPNADHVLRLVGGQYIDTKDNRESALGGGFISKPKDDNKPSCNWLECFLPDIQALPEQVQKIRELSRLKLGAKGRFAKINVGQVVTYIQRNTVNQHILTIIKDPLEADGQNLADPSHALIANVPDENDPNGELIGDLIAECVIELYPAKI
jgi:hypothetical protein